MPVAETDQPDKTTPSRSRRLFRGAEILINLPIVILLITLAGPPIWNRLFGANPVRATEVRFFHLDEQVAVGREIRIARTVRGAKCGGQSLTDEAATQAARCYSRTSSAVFDPCWDKVAIRGEYPGLVCVNTPWSRTATLISKPRWLKQVAARPPQFDTTPPWALELGDGTPCVYVVGDTFAAAGGRASYVCTRTWDWFPDYFPRPGLVKAWIIGEPRRRRPVWSVDVLKTGDTSTRPQPVRIAWF
jgi:hypothetical protein